ncbi:MAG: (2Fe-2S) ferredoxin domain-containing protein [Crocosphaera sp.]|nr:(2Fe-2S) ferredoxin domain-containing protein [Crocosphaera sp.]
MSKNPSFTAVEEPKIDSSDSPKCVVVCQHRRCANLGSRDVLTAFLANPSTKFSVIGSGCLKQCGNGPMVRILPEKTWYHNIKPEQVTTLIKQHLLGGKPVTQLLYPRFHTQPTNHSTD